MPTYKVLEKGFHGARIYDPVGKRRKLHTDEPFPSKNGKEQVPSWLEAVEPETTANKKRREKAAKKAAEKIEQDQKDVMGASFITDSNAVETL